MKVASLARELRVPPQMLLNCLRVLRISVIDEEDGISEGDVALIRARLELVKTDRARSRIMKKQLKLSSKVLSRQESADVDANPPKTQLKKNLLIPTNLSLTNL